MTFLEVTLWHILKHEATLSKFTACVLAASYHCQRLLTLWPVCGVPKNHQQFKNISTWQSSDITVIGHIYHLTFPEDKLTEI